MNEILNTYQKEILLILIAVLTVITGYMIGAKNQFIYGFTAFIIIGLVLYFKFPKQYVSVLIYPQLIGLFIGFLLGYGTKEEPINEEEDIPFRCNNGRMIIKNVYAGVAIFGGSGSGKTSFILQAIVPWLVKKNVKTFVHDYKDGELTESLLPFYGENLKIIALHRPEISSRINILDERYIPRTSDISKIMQTLVFGLTNFNENSNPNKYFYSGAVGVISGVTIVFSRKFKDFCTLPHIVAFLTLNDFSHEEKIGDFVKKEPYKKLVDFLLLDDDAKVQANDFISATAGTKSDTASNILSTLMGALKQISYPNYFWVLSKNEVDLDIRNPDNPYSISILNKPEDEEILSPVLTTLFQISTNKLMKKSEQKVCLLLDEAGRFKLKNMGTIVSTMRTFGVSTVYCTQDLSQGYKNYTIHEFDEIMANLATQVFGKANHPKQAKFYEEYFEPITRLNKSTSSKNTDFLNIFETGDSKTLTEKEVKKVRSHEFIKFRPGKFAFISGGKNKLIQMPAPKINNQKIKEKTGLEHSIEVNFRKINEESKKILNTL